MPTEPQAIEGHAGQGGQSPVAGLWRHPDFLKLWAGQTVSLCGSEVTALALPLTAVLVLKAGPAQMGLLRAIESVPALLVALLAGVWVDRVRRRPLLIGANLGRAALLGSIPVAASLGLLRLDVLYIVAFAAGTLAVVFSVAYSAFFPSLVAPEHLVEGNTKLEMSRSVAQIAGTGLGGTLVQLLTAPVAIAVDAFSFVVSALSIAAIRAPETRPAPRGGRRGIQGEIGEGLRVMGGDGLLRALTGSTAVINLFAGIQNTLYVLYAIRTLHLSPALLGLVGAVYSACGLLGVVLGGWVVRRRGVGPTITGAALLIGVSSLLLPAAAGPSSASVALFAGGMGLMGIGDAVYNINASSLRQAITPRGAQGRVAASMRMVILGGQVVGAFLGGILGGWIGLRPMLAVAGAGMLLGFVWLVLSPARTLHTIPSRHKTNEGTG